MSKLQDLFKKSEGSGFYTWILNYALSIKIPFNKPHGFKVFDSKPGEVKVLLPYKRKNLNHVHSLHACALATLCEFTTGLAITGLLSETEYRILLKSIRIEYHYQGKMDVWAKMKLDDEYIEYEIKAPLKSEDAVLKELEIKVYDIANNHICTGFINWQIKKWEKAKTK